MRWAQVLLLGVAAAAACGKSNGNSGTGGSDAGPMGPTKLSVTWAFTGQAASASTCMAHGAAQVSVTLSATIDPTLHQTTTVDCTKGSVSFGSPLVQDLGMPFVEATLLDDKGVTVTTASANVTPTVGTTAVKLDFYPASGTGGAGGMASTSSSSSSTTASSSTSGMGGAGGTGGTSGTSSSSSAASSSSSSSSSSSGAGGADAG